MTVKVTTYYRLLYKLASHSQCEHVINIKNYNKVSLI